jgi:hypothetical protein
MIWGTLLRGTVRFFVPDTLCIRFGYKIIRALLMKYYFGLTDSVLSGRVLFCMYSGFRNIRALLMKYYFCLTESVLSGRVLFCMISGFILLCIVSGLQCFGLILGVLDGVFL